MLETSPMRLEVMVENDEVDTRILDLEFGEEYTQHQVKGQTGSFVSSIRREYLDWMHKICDACTDIDSFRSPDAVFIKKYLRETYGDVLEYLWKTPDAAAVRRADTRKWYACFMHVSRQKFGLDSDEVIEVMNLHIQTEQMPAVLNEVNIFPGFHMNKKYWISVCLDGTLNRARMIELIRVSYELAKKK